MTLPSPEQVNILKLGRIMRDGVNSEFWLAFKQVLQHHIDTREALIRTPLHALPQVGADGLPTPYAAGDLATRAAVMESVKGALITLKLVTTLPDTIIAQASDLAKENSSD